MSILGSPNFGKLPFNVFPGLIRDPICQYYSKGFRGQPSKVIDGSGVQGSRFFEGSLGKSWLHISYW